MTPSPSLPVVGPPDVPIDRARLTGTGFAWWDAQIVDEHGNGVILWWGYGLPEARLIGGFSAPAITAPSLAVLVIAGGAPSFWLHQRYDEQDADWEVPAGRWRFGGTQIEASRDAHAQVLIARIDCALPGTRLRLTGHLEMGGVPRRASSDTLRGDDEWAPLMGPGEGRAILSVGGEARFHLKGRAHHHRHGRSLGLEDEGRLVWGHAAFPDHTRAFQVRLSSEGHSEATGAIVSVDGRTEIARNLDVEVDGDISAWSRLTLRRGDEPWLQVQRERVVLERELSSTSLTKSRAPMALPVVGLVQELDLGGFGDVRGLTRARTFLHHASGPNPFRVRFTTGTQHRRWRRALPFL